MPSFCFGFTSQPKAGIAASVVVDQQYIQNLLPPALAWIYPYLPFMHGLEIGNVGTFCAADPPTVLTVPTAAQFFNFITSGPIQDLIYVTNFLESITKYYLWFQLCECATGSTPSGSASPSPPANLPDRNPPPVAVLPAPTTCGQTIFHHASIGAAGSNNQGYDDQFGDIYTQAAFTFVNTPHPSTHPTITIDVQWIGAHAPAITPVLRTTTYSLATGATVTALEAVPQGAVAVLFTSHTPVGGSTDGLDITIDWYCGPGVPGTPILTPCPPDERVRQLLEQIYKLLTLVQRQSAPFGYIYGTNHAGLTGSGEITVADLIGVSVDVTTNPGYTGLVVGDPATIFKIGRIDLGSADGWITSRDIDHDGSLMLPYQAGVFTKIGYTLNPGVVVAIRELVREA
jgi:hypothetical protein